MKFKEWYEEWVYENGSYKLVALFITLILWVSVLGRKETTVAKEIPLSFSVMDNRIVTAASARSVRYELSGSRRALRKFVAEKTEPITIDINGASVGRLMVTIPDDSIRLPFGVKVQNINPSSVVIEVDEVVKKRVPVVLVWKDATEQNKFILGAKVEPSEIEIEGARQALAKVREVLTAEITSEEAQEQNGEKVIRTKIKSPEIDGIKPLTNEDVVVRFK